MKKLFSIFVMLLICLLCPCGAQGNKLFDLSDEVYAPKGFTFKTDKAHYDRDVKEITLCITNTGDGEMAIGESFELHYKADGAWKKVGFKRDTAFNELAWIIPPVESHEATVKLDEYYNLPLKTGEYRIVKDGFTSNTFEVR